MNNISIQPVKMLIVHAQSNRNDCGGSFRILNYFLKGLDQKRFDTHVVLSFLDKNYSDTNAYPIQLLKTYGVKIHSLYVPMNQLNFNIWRVVKYFSELLYSTWLLLRIMRREKIKIVYTNSLNILASGFAARIARVLSIYHIHEIVRKPKLIAKYLVRLVGGLSDTLICVSEAAKSPFLEVGVAHHKLVHVPNCIDLNEFSPSKKGNVVRDEFSSNGCEKIVASVGRLVPKKGHNYVIDAAKQVSKELRGVKFLIIGDSKSNEDCYAQELIEQVERNGLENQVIFTGPRTDIPEIMAAVDVVVLAAASRATPESFGLVILEALAMGTPVVASDLGGISEVLKHGETGYLVSAQNSKAIADAILELLQNEQAAQKMGRTGQSWVRKNFSADRYSNKVQELLLNIVQNEAHAAISN